MLFSTCRNVPFGISGVPLTALVMDLRLWAMPLGWPVVPEDLEEKSIKLSFWSMWGLGRCVTK